MSRLVDKLQTRCARCRLRLTLCLCDQFPDFEELKTSLTLLIHRHEGKTTTNTGLLACEVLPDSRVLWRGVQSFEGKPSWFERDQVYSPQSTPLFLFPSAEATVMDFSWRALRRRENPHERFTLIVPDGSWGQASKVGKREPALEGVMRVVLPPGPESEYHLRREPHRHFVSTFEAIARAMGVLEGPMVQEKLEALFRKFVGRQLWSRGDLTAEQVLGGIPEAAIIERKKSGFPKGSTQ
jgi:DTW domain-containing protein YfiP